jgi:HPt (histidine-containing phosphotransfer) domain-containing protein
MSESGAIDQGVLDGLLASVGGDTDFLAELVQDYLSDSPQQLAAMETALVAGDGEGLRRAAHSLKSNSATFGAATLSSLCKELEDMGKAGAFEGAEAKLGQAAAEYERARRALEDL